MSDFGERLRAIRKENNLSQEELADILGTSKQVISRYENGQRTPKVTVAAEFAKRLGVPMSTLSGEDDIMLPSNIQPISEMQMQRVPMLGEIAAGVPIMAEEDYGAFVSTPIQCDFALTVRGNSMEPTYLEGDVVYIRQQDDVDDGQVAAVAIDGEATLKHVYHIPNGVHLVSDNMRYRPMIYTLPDCDNIRILGIVMGYTRMYGAKVNRS